MAAAPRPARGRARSGSGVEGVPRGAAGVALPGQRDGRSRRGPAAAAAPSPAGTGAPGQRDDAANGSPDEAGRGRARAGRGRTVGGGGPVPAGGEAVPGPARPVHTSRDRAADASGRPAEHGDAEGLAAAGTTARAEVSVARSRPAGARRSRLDPRTAPPREPDRYDGASPGPGTAGPAADPRVLVRGIGRAAVRLDAALLDSLLRRVVAQHGLADAWDTVLRPALRAIGRTWAASGDAAGERFVEAEHLLSWQISTVVRACTPPVPAPADGMDARPVVVACTPGENHTLAAEVLTAVLAERGVPVRMFGAAVPVGALADAVRRSGPRAVVLWSQRHATADAEAVRRVRETGWGIRGARRHPAVLLAGPGWTALRESDGLHRPRTLSQALGLLLPDHAPSASR
ncbi:cobalamin-dependent protein [Streptomyces sp. NPDC060194]|uniref:cobalamin-dependent protein n=1 Tax=Streptomyces sp. NPDC060194 TaxID=3347069 RepID=UPI00364BF1DA